MEGGCSSPRRAYTAVRPLALHRRGTTVGKERPATGAYLLSFLVIGVRWLTQHALFGRIGTVDSRLLRLYFALLAIVAALPFPTKLISEYGQTAVATACYSGAIALAVACLCAMYLRLLAAPALAAPDTEPRAAAQGGPS